MVGSSDPIRCHGLVLEEQPKPVLSQVDQMAESSKSLLASSFPFQGSELLWLKRT